MARCSTVGCDQKEEREIRKPEIGNEEIRNGESPTTNSDAEASYSYHLKGRSV